MDAPKVDGVSFAEEVLADRFVLRLQFERFARQQVAGVRQGVCDLAELRCAQPCGNCIAVPHIPNVVGESVGIRELRYNTVDVIGAAEAGPDPVFAHRLWPRGPRGGPWCPTHEKRPIRLVVLVRLG